MLTGTVKGGLAERQYQFLQAESQRRNVPSPSPRVVVYLVNFPELQGGEYSISIYVCVCVFSVGTHSHSCGRVYGTRKHCDSVDESRSFAKHNQCGEYSLCCLSLPATSVSPGSVSGCP